MVIKIYRVYSEVVLQDKISSCEYTNSHFEHQLGLFILVANKRSNLDD